MSSILWDTSEAIKHLLIKVSFLALLLMLTRFPDESRDTFIYSDVSFQVACGYSHNLLLVLCVTISRVGEKTILANCLLDTGSGCTCLASSL